MSQRVFNLAEAPMAKDRNAGWEYFRSFGDVFEAGGSYYFTSADAVNFACQNPEIFSSAKAFEALGSPFPMVPVAIDPPEHVRYRRVLDPMIGPRVVKAMEEELRRQISQMIDLFADRGSFDAVEDLAKLYPTQVFLTLFGLPLADRERFREWAVFILDEGAPKGQPSPPEEVMAAAGAVIDYLNTFIERKRASPGDDMLSRVLQIEGEGQWSDEEIFGLSFLFILAGLDTVSAGIEFTLFQLAQHPELQLKVLQDPSLIGPLIEETLRLDPPAPITPRVTLSEVTVGGVNIPEGSHVNLVFGAANRDPERFPFPNELSLETAGRNHFSFGSGIHRCLGQHLAKAEIRLVIEELGARIGTFTLAPGVEPEMQWPSGTSRLVSLPLVFEDRAS